MSLVLNESLVLAKTRSQDLKSVLKLNCWGSGIKDASLVRQLVNVEVIGLSCNEISTLEDFASCKKLRELILRKNKIENIAEIAHLQALPNLANLWLEENPCAENTFNYRKVVLKALPRLTTLDNKPVTKEELREIEELGDEIYEEIPCTSTASSGSGPPSTRYIVEQNELCEISNQRFSQATTINQQQEPYQIQPISETVCNHSVGNEVLEDTLPFNINDSLIPKSHSLQQQQSRGSMSALNGGGSVQQGWPSGIYSTPSNNLNNNLLPKGGKIRNGNILSAVLCLVKELDYVSCEVVQTALHCRMEECISQ